jgi:hypothetical protein
MDRNDKAVAAGPESRQGGGPYKPGRSKRPRKGSAVPDDRAPADRQPPARSEDFGGRRDIETADQPAEEHDRRHHDRDAEVGRPV